MKNLFCIVIPIYKEIPDPIEIISLNRLNKIIGEKNYDVYFITHEELNIEKYVELYPCAKTKFFDKSFFESTKSYSYLCLSYELYNTFNEYKKMFIYQTDCYLIEDKFDTFANLEYDYIGAPVFSNDCGWPTVTKDENGNSRYFPVIGNGGFSMRDIETFMIFTDPNGEVKTTTHLTEQLIKEHCLFEDLFICVDLPKVFDINIATFPIGLMFAWDMSVDVIYDFLKVKQFPMCIHAWDKNIRFWQKYLPELINNEEIVNYCEEKHKEFFRLYYNERNETYR